MKFIHLADLHIGKRVNGFSMIDDQLHILQQILNHIDEQQPQAVLICGDVYDKPVPAIEAVQLFDWFLTELIQRQVIVMVIAGNHDSPERVGFASRIVNQQGLFIAGTFTGQLQTVTLKDQWGDVDFYLLPFLKPAFVRRYFPDDDLDSYDQAVATVLQAASPDTSRRNVLLSHQFYIGAGSEPERSESEIISVGGVDNIHTAHVTDFDYVALGHLHGPQQVTQPHIRYSGSPLKYSFSECHHQKAALLVELKEKGNLTLTPLALKPRHDLRKIKGPLSQLLSIEVASAGNREDYLHVTLTDEEEIHDAIGKLRSVYPNVMTLTFENNRTKALASFSEALPDTLTDPQQLFADFFQLQNGQALSPDQEALISSLLEKKGGAL